MRKCKRKNLKLPLDKCRSKIYNQTIASNPKERIMNDFEAINDLLNQMADQGMVEPSDDPSINVDFWDWADVVGVVDEFIPEEYTV